MPLHRFFSSKGRGAWLDRLQIPLFLLALGLLFFIGGTLAAYFEHPVYLTIKDAIEGGRAYIGQKRMEAARSEVKFSADHTIRQAKVSHWQKDKAYNGYTLVILRFSTSAYLVDMDGKVVHKWAMPFFKAWPSPSHINTPVASSLIYFEGAVLMPNGDLIVQYSGLTDTPWGYGVVRLDKDSSILWKYTGHAHHNLSYDQDNRQLVVLVHDFIEKPTGKEYRGLQYPLLTDGIVLLSEEGRVRKHIDLLKAFKASGYEQYLNAHPPIEDVAWDFMHLNSAVALPKSLADKFPMFKPGQILFSLRNMSLIGVLDPRTEKVVWAARGPWAYQHDAKFLDNGHILLLDNIGCYVKRKVCSRVIELDPATSKITWTFPDLVNEPGQYKFLDVVLGHVQRLPNGNTLILQPYDGKIIEVTQDGKIVWQYKVRQFFNHTERKGSEFQRQNDPKMIYPKQHLGDIALKLNNVLIYSERFAPEDLPFLKNRAKKKSSGKPARKAP